MSFLLQGNRQKLGRGMACQATRGWDTAGAAFSTTPLGMEVSQCS